VSTANRFYAFASLPDLSGTAMAVRDPKADVREFWDASSCGEVYAQGLDDEQRFGKHAEARYRLEPYIRSFARFKKATTKMSLK